MSYEITGTLKKVYDTQTFASGFTKREFVVTTEDDRYPQEVALACTRDDCAQLDNLQLGERLRVTFRIRGREYNGRHFVNLDAYKVERLDSAGGAEDAPPDHDPFAGEIPTDDDAMQF